MSLNFRFAIISDPHVGLPHTIWNLSNRFHLIEISIPALELVLDQLMEENIDFLLLPGDLTQHGEPDNHTWLANRLARLPFPVYVIPGNHDVPVLNSDRQSISWTDFAHYYQKCGYAHTERLYYTCLVRHGVRLIALNSNIFDADGNQLGRLDREQLRWLEDVLITAKTKDELVLLMVHHNVLEHLPDQSNHPMGRRYMLDNAAQLRQLLQKYQVQLVFTGHLHAQHIADSQGLYDITTGSLVGYPHPYRILEFRTDPQGHQSLKISSNRVKSLPGWPDLPVKSRELMGDRSYPFMMRLLSSPPLELPKSLCEELVPSLRYFWADIANGDAHFNFSHFPPKVGQYFHRFSATDVDGQPLCKDNNIILQL
jgi:3',5'-cyclic AMP phosphodiesterase CpdA